MAAELTDEQIKRVADRLWEMGEISSMNPITAVTFARAILALATQQATQGAEPVAYIDPLADEAVTASRWAKWPAHNRARYTVQAFGAPPPTAEVEKDAARYRFLRGSPWDWQVEHLRSGWATYYGGKNLDAAIDAALQSDQAQAGEEPPPTTTP